MDNTQKKRIKVLYLTGWYPNEEHSESGIFIKRHALSVLKYCDVAVLYTHLGEIEDKVDVAEEDGLFVVRVYRTSGKVLDRLVNKLAGPVLTSIIILLLGSLQGLKITKNNFGMPDVVHLNVTFYFHLGLIALALKLLLNIPYIITEHHIGYTKEENKFMQESFFVRWMIRLICGNAEAITTVSNSLKDDMTRCGINNTFCVIPNVIDSDFAHNKDSRKYQKKIMLHVSLLNDAQKNVSGMIEAISILSKKRDDFELHIIGNGPDRGKLEDLADGYGLLNNRIFFHGRVDPDILVESMKSCNFFVLFSNVETFSVVTAEALACGKPVIATKCGGPEEFVLENCGILIEPRDKDALMNAMDYMLDNFSSYNSQEIREYAKNKFSSDAVGEEFFRIYQKVIK